MARLPGPKKQGSVSLGEALARRRSERSFARRTLDREQISQLARAALDQGYVREAPASIVIAAVYQRTERRYGDRAARYVWIEAGHVAQNIHLQAVAMGLGSVPIRAFDDRQVHRVLSLPEDRMPLYIIPVGYTAE